MDNFKIGSEFTEEFSYTQNDVNTFADISGDKNPIHLDENFAVNSIFGKRIIHGYLGASIFSKVFAMSFPGEGTIYLKQDLKFLKPMFVDVNYIAKFEVLDIISEKNRSLVLTEIFDFDQNIVVSGEALIQNKNFIK